MRRPSSAVMSLGRDSEERVPCPSCPRDPPPHEYTRPDSVSMRQCSFPHTTSVTFSRGDSGGEGSNSSGDGRLQRVVQLDFTRKWIFNSTRSGPKIPAAGYLEGEGFFGFKDTDPDFGCCYEQFWNFVRTTEFWNFVRTTEFWNFVRTTEVWLF